MEFYEEYPVSSIYAPYFGVNSTIVYAASCDLILGALKSGKK